MDGKVKVLTQDREDRGNPGLRLWWGVEERGLVWLFQGLEAQVRGLLVGLERRGAQSSSDPHMARPWAMGHGTKCGRHSWRGKFKAGEKVEGASQVVLVGKNPPANAGDVRDTGSIPGSGRSPGGGNKATHSSILAWKIPRTEEPGRPQFLGSQRVRHD